MRDQLENMRFTDIELEGNVIKESSQCETKLAWDVRTGSRCTYKMRFDSLMAAIKKVEFDLGLDDDFELSTVPPRRLTR